VEALMHDMPRIAALWDVAWQQIARVALHPRATVRVFGVPSLTQVLLRFTLYALRLTLDA
jgi:hypothetical protein